MLGRTLSAAATAVYILVQAVRIVGLIGICWRRWSTRKSAVDHIPKSSTPVTILRPMKGADSRLRECLRSSLRQLHPFELILLVEDAEDPACKVAEDLLAEYPTVDARVLIGNDEYGPNPKINNLVKGYKAAKHDIIWVLDSNAKVAPWTLSRAVALFEQSPDIQLVHHTPIVLAEEGGWGAVLDEVYMLTAHDLFYVGINDVAIAPCVMGKSNLYRRSQLDAATGSNLGEGLQKFAKYMAEDHMIAQALWDQGGRTVLAADPVIQPLGYQPLSAFVSRRVRWIRLRKYMVVLATLLEPSTDCFVCGLIGMAAWPGRRTARFALSNIACWFLLDFTAFTVLRSHSRLKKIHTLWGFTRAWFLREFMAFPIWAWAILGTRIEWRGRPFKINTDLTAVPA